MSSMSRTTRSGQKRVGLEGLEKVIGARLPQLALERSERGVGLSYLPD